MNQPFAPPTPPPGRRLTLHRSAIIRRHDLATRQLRYRHRPSRLEIVSTWFCLAVAGWAVIYFAAQMVLR